VGQDGRHRYHGGESAVIGGRPVLAHRGARSDQAEGLGGRRMPGAVDA
jgi:hypothetical protein